MGKEKEILSTAFNLLKNREYSVQNLKRKLEFKFPNSENSVEKTLEYLIQKKYLSDERFAEIYINSKLRGGFYGRYYFFKKLREKGISNEIIENTLSNLSYDETHNARELFEKKIKTLKESDKRKKKEKLSRFLASRGFSADVIYEVIEKI